MRRDVDRLISAELGPRDWLACEELKAAAQLDSDANLVRAALYCLAVQVVGAGHVDTSLFALRTNGAEKRQSAGAAIKRAVSA